jgi:hypothetical protein
MESRCAETAGVGRLLQDECVAVVAVLVHLAKAVNPGDWESQTRPDSESSRQRRPEAVPFAAPSRGPPQGAEAENAYADLEGFASQAAE